MSADCVCCVNAPGHFGLRCGHMFYRISNFDREPRRKNGPRRALFPWIHGTLWLHPGHLKRGKKKSRYVYSYAICWCIFYSGFIHYFCSTVHELETLQFFKWKTEICKVIVGKCIITFNLYMITWIFWIFRNILQLIFLFSP